MTYKSLPFIVCLITIKPWSDFLQARSTQVATLLRLFISREEANINHVPMEHSKPRISYCT